MSSQWRDWPVSVGGPRPAAATDRTIIDTPHGPVRFLHTIEFEPDAAGTIIHYRFAAPDTEEERELGKDIAPAYGDTLRSRIPGLIEQLDDELAARLADPEPQLGGRRAGGIPS